MVEFIQFDNLGKGDGQLILIGRWIGRLIASSIVRSTSSSFAPFFDRLLDRWHEASPGKM